MRPPITPTYGACRGTPHTTTGETAVFLMMRRELHLPDQLQDHETPRYNTLQQQHVIELRSRLAEARDILRDQQLNVWHEDRKESLLFAVGNLVLLANKRRRKGRTPSYSLNLCGPIPFLRHTKPTPTPKKDKDRSQYKMKRD